MGSHEGGVFIELLYRPQESQKHPTTVAIDLEQAMKDDVFS